MTTYVAYIGGDNQIIDVQKRLDTVRFGQFTFQLTQGQYETIKDNVTFAGTDVFRYHIVGGNVEEKPDNRTRVVVEGSANGGANWGSIPLFRAEVGDALLLRFRVVDDLGETVDVGGDFYMKLPAMPEQFVKITLTAGISQSFTLDTTRPGKITIGSNELLRVEQPMTVEIYEAANINTEPLE